MSTRPLKRYCDGPPQYGLNIAATEYANDGVRMIRTSDIRPDGSLTGAEHGVFVPPACVETRHRLQAGDVLFSRSGTLGRSIRVAEVASRMTFAGFLVRFRPIAEVDSRFLEYCANSATFQASVEADAVTSTISNFNAEKYGEVPLPDIDPDRQRAIADYLDTETTRIDALITKKQRMIELLRERQVVAESEAVLESGSQATRMPTIPTVPASWRVPRNKTYMREVSELSRSGAEEMLSVSHLTGVTPRSEKTVNMFEAESTVGYKKVRPGDLVINTMWAWMGAAGVARVPGIVSPAYGVYRVDPRVMAPDYFDIVVRTPAYIMEMTRFSRGVTSSRLRLYPEEFLALTSPVPPLEEQRRIVEWCLASRKRTTALVERLNSQIELLSEHRQALITAAVTGEFEVPGVAA